MEAAPLLSGARRREPAWPGMPGRAAVATAGLAAVALAALAGMGSHRRVALLGMPLPLTSMTAAERGDSGEGVGAMGGMQTASGHVLYSDWRGTALEGVDSWSFSHSWKGSVDIHEREQTVVAPPALALKKRPMPPALAETAGTLRDSYSVHLGGDWKPGQAAALLDTLDDMCSRSAGAPHAPADNCNMKQETTWTIHTGRLPDDVQVQGGAVSVAARALDFSAPRGATLDGDDGTVASRRLQFAVMRVVTNFGQNKEVVGQILKRRFGAQLGAGVDPGYTTLTSTTTYEDAERFQHFKSPETLFMLEAWTLMPPNMHNVAGLKYVTRRQQGLDHPLYGPTTAVSWPTNLDQSYQEYMDYSFNNDGYTSRHLFIHEKTHFFWGRHWSESLKEGWEGVGAWKDKDGAGTWGTPTTTAFSSDYGASNNPDEDLAECMAAYVLHPVLLQVRAPDKHAYIKKNIARGVQYLERPEVTFKVANDSPYRRYPASLSRVDIHVKGAPEEDKEVDVKMLVDTGEGWHSPVHAEVSLAGPSGGSKTLELYPDPDAGGEDGNNGVVTLRVTETLSKLYEKGFWTASQIKIKDKLGNERWVKVGEYSWRLYLNNQQGTAWAPRYLKNTVKLQKSVEYDEVAQQHYPVVTASMRFQRTGAALKDKDPVWMRLAAKPAADHADWKSSGSSEYNYPIYQTGKCVEDENSYDGTCTVTWKLSPNSPKGSYYVSMINLEDSVGNVRQQFFTLQKAGWTCCGRVGNTPDDEDPVFVHLEECAVADDGDACVDPDITPPELDRDSVRGSMTPADEEEPDGSGSVHVKFRARDDKAGIGTVQYRVMDPQGFSHSGYMEHDNQYGATFHGDPTEWKEYNLKVKLARGSPPGQWRLESLDLHDKAGNRRHHQFIELLIFSADAY